MVRSASDSRGRDGRGRSDPGSAGPTLSSSACSSSSGLVEYACDSVGVCCARLGKCCADVRRDSVPAVPGLLKVVPSSASRDEGSGVAPMLARVLRGGTTFANSPETARVRGDACRMGFLAIERLELEEDGERPLRRSCEGMERSFGLRRSPPERLSRDGLARRAMGRTGFEDAAGVVAAADKEEDEFVADE
jgi:hypothetical protein